MHSLRLGGRKRCAERCWSKTNAKTGAGAGGSRSRCSRQVQDSEHEHASSKAANRSTLVSLPLQTAPAPGPYGLFLLSGGFGRLVFCGGGVGCGLGDRTLSGSFGGRLSPPLPWPKAPADTRPIITSTINSRNFFIFSLSLPCFPRAWEGERMRRPRLEQSRCQRGDLRGGRIPPEILTVKRKKSHRLRLASHGMVQAKG